MRGQGQSSKGLKEHRDKVRSATCTHRRRVVAEPVVAEPEGAPVPYAVGPTEAADEQDAIAAAVNGAPEEDVAGVALPIFLPFVGDEVWVGEQVVEDVGVQDGLARQLLAELVAFEHLAILLAVCEEELDLFRVELPLAALLVFLDGEATLGPRIERVGVAVNEVFGHDQLDVSLPQTADVGNVVALAQPVNVGEVGDAVADNRLLEFGGEANIERDFAHNRSPLRQEVRIGQIVAASGLLRCEGLP